MIDDSLRAMPETRPDDESATHKAACKCVPCRRPGSMVYKKRYMRQMRMRS